MANMNATTIEIELNGRPRAVRNGSTVADLVLELGLRPEIVAVEVNEELVTRDRRGRTSLCDGDRVELVTMVGGG
jgi:thiamine biosynthesis protein ThiS